MLVPRPTCGFQDILGCNNSTIIVGGRNINNNQFAASMNCNANGGWWNMSLIGSSIVTKPTPVNGVVETPIDGVLQRFYTRPDGKLEWEMIYESEPANKVLQFRLTHSGLLLYKQLLTLGDIAGGAAYAYPEAEGSYAIYCNKRDGKYQTGKVGHIDRFWVKDANGLTAWVDMGVYPDGVGQELLVATLPEVFMRNAQYPVIFGPTLGYDTQGSLSFNFGALLYYPRPYLASVNGTVTKINIYTGTAGVSIKAAVANTSGAAYRATGQSLIAVGAEATTVAGWTQLTATSLASVVAGSRYRPGWIANNATCLVYYDLGGSSVTQEYLSTPYAGQMSDPVPAFMNINTVTTLISIYADISLDGVAGNTIIGDRMGAGGLNNVF